MGGLFQLFGKRDGNIIRDLFHLHPGVGDGQGSLAGCTRSCKELDMTERLHIHTLLIFLKIHFGKHCPGFCGAQRVKRLPAMQETQV